MAAFVTAQLRHEGLIVNHKKVMRLMQENGLSVRPRRRFVVTTDSAHGGPVFANRARTVELSGPKPTVGRRHHLHRDCNWLRLPGRLKADLTGGCQGRPLYPQKADIEEDVAWSAPHEFFNSLSQKRKSAPKPIITMADDIRGKPALDVLRGDGAQTSQPALRRPLLQVRSGPNHLS